MTEQNENIVPLFKQAKGNCSVVLPSGRVVMFAAGKFYTEEKRLIEQLLMCAEHNDYGIYIDPAEPSIDTLAATPLEAMRKKIRAEVMAELRTGGKLVDNTTYGQATAQNLGVGSSLDQAPEVITGHSNTAPPLQTGAPVVVSGEGDVVKTDTLSALEKLKSKGNSR